MSDGSSIGVHLDRVDWILKTHGQDACVTENTAVEESCMFAHAMTEEIYALRIDDCNSPKYSEAKHNEIQKWKSFGVYKEVNKHHYPDQEVLSCRWVGSEKDENGNTSYKARLVICGFEESDSIVADSPTASKTMLRLFLVVSNIYGWDIETLDVRAAFLQSDNIKRTVLIKPPKEFRVDTSTVWKLNKPVYGLNDAARCWYLTVRKCLLKLGCESIEYDKSVYIYIKDNVVRGFLVIHVDDFLSGGDSMFKENVLIPLKKTFKMGVNHKKKFRYIGWDIEQNDDGIFVNQDQYMNSIQQMDISSVKDGECSLNEREKKRFQQILGQLQWITSQTRPDRRFDTLLCSMVASSPKVKDVAKMNKAIKNLKKTTYDIKYPKMNKNDIDHMHILVFADAALHNQMDKVTSTQGHVIFLAAGNNLVAPISWSSKKIRRVIKNILNGECIALSNAIDEAIFLREIIVQVFGPGDFPIRAFTDSRSLYDNVYSEKQAEDLKLRREVKSLRQSIELKEIESIKWVPTEIQLANCLTKSTGSSEPLINILVGGTLINICAKNLIFC